MGKGLNLFDVYEKEHTAAQKIAEQTGATPICCDVADHKAVQTAFSQIPDVDILVCNAGICHYGLMSQMEESAWDRLFAVNVKGIYHCVNAATPYFLKKQAGCIITVSSMWGEVGASCEAGYSATKGAIISMSKTAAKELAPQGIRVNAVAPGIVQTERFAELYESDGNKIDERIQRIALGRLGTPEDVAHACVFLASNKANYISGQILGVDGCASI